MARRAANIGTWSTGARPRTAAPKEDTVFNKTIVKLQTERLNTFLPKWLREHQGWQFPAVADRFANPSALAVDTSLPADQRTFHASSMRIWIRDDDLADRILSDPAFEPVLESFYLRHPSSDLIKAAVAAASPDVPDEPAAILVSALRLTSARVEHDPGLLPFTRRLAAGVNLWKRGLAGR